MLLVGKLVNIPVVLTRTANARSILTLRDVLDMYEGNVLKFLSHILKGQSYPCARLQGLPGSTVATVIAR